MEVLVRQTLEPIDGQEDTRSPMAMERQSAMPHVGHQPHPITEQQEETPQDTVALDVERSGCDLSCNCVCHEERVFRYPKRLSRIG